MVVIVQVSKRRTPVVCFLSEHDVIDVGRG